MSWNFLTAAPAALQPQRTIRPSAVRSLGVTGEAPMISIIIPAHNEEAYIGQTLEQLLRQEYPRFEVIVVANGCSDQTCAVASDRCHRLIVLEGRGLSRARNVGARAAQGDILIFLDADTMLPPRGLWKIAREFKRGYAAATVRGEPDLPRWRYKVMYALKNFMHWSGLHGGSSGIIICWKEDFEKTKGFDEDLHVRENSALIRELRRMGGYTYIGCVSATTSMRRYETIGPFETIWLWTRIWLQSLAGRLRNKDYAAIR